MNTRATPWRIHPSPSGHVVIVDVLGLPVTCGSVQPDDAPAMSLAHEMADLLERAPRAHEKTCATKLDEEAGCTCWRGAVDDLLVLMRGGGRR